MNGELPKLVLQELSQKGTRCKKPSEQIRGKLLNIRLIDDRLEEVNGRMVPCYWEDDLIIGKYHKSALNMSVERQTRYVYERQEWVAKYPTK